MSQKNVTVVGVFVLSILLYFVVSTFLQKSGASVTLQSNSDQSQTIGSIEEANIQTTMKLKSQAFLEGEFIPARYSCVGRNINPPLLLTGVPADTKSLAIIMDDPDVPKQIKADGVFDHWVVFNIPPTVRTIDEGAVVGRLGVNGSGEEKYTGPCPPSQYQPTTHRYIFTVYALDVPHFDFIQSPTKQTLLNSMQGHIIGQAELMGKFDRTMLKRI